MQLVVSAADLYRQKIYRTNEEPNPLEHDVAKAFVDLEAASKDLKVRAGAVCLFCLPSRQNSSHLSSECYEVGNLFVSRSSSSPSAFCSRKVSQKKGVWAHMSTLYVYRTVHSALDTLWRIVFS